MSNRSAAISAFAQAMVWPSASTSASSDVSCADRSPLIVASTACTTSATISGSEPGWPARIAASRSPSPALLPSAMNQHLLDLVAQRLGVERLDDVVGDAGLLGGHHVLHLALGGDHDERRGLQLCIRPHLLQQLQAGHRHHV